VDENVLLAPLDRDKPEPFDIVEPLDDAADHFVGHALLALALYRACRGARILYDARIITRRALLDNELVTGPSCSR